MACYVDGNCLRLSIASAIQADPRRIPDPTPDYRYKDWFDRYNERLKPALGIRLEEIPPGSCPPRGHTNWIAVLRREFNDHAVLCRGAFIIGDPQGSQLNGRGVRDQEIAYGLRILPVNAPVTDAWGRKVA